MSYDPKLKECMAKIEALCRQYDCGAYVALVSKTHGEFRPVLPPWQAVSEEENTYGRVVGYRLKCAKEEHERADLTAHFIYSMRDQAVNAFKIFEHLCEMTAGKWKTEHTSFSSYRPHRKEEN